MSRDPVLTGTGPVAVAMSGGVDSTAAAVVLRDAGYELSGVTLRLSDDDASPAAAAAICDSLGIAHETIDARAEFRAAVTAPFARAYRSGLTPNPCVDCNERVKFGLLARAAASLGAGRLATGHYARTVRVSGGMALARAGDPAKDQSYFLYRVPRAALAHVLFPLGELRKHETREIVSRAGLAVPTSRESQDACFLKGLTVAQYLTQAGERGPGFEPGPVVARDGTVLGSHRGLVHYTVGQRSGMPASGAGPLYVVAIDAERNTIVAGPAQEAASSVVRARDVIWYGEAEERVSAQVRARMEPVPAVARVSGAGIPGATGRVLTVTFDEPVTAAPGQSVVCYKDDVVIGGGIVTAGGHASGGPDA